MERSLLRNRLISLCVCLVMLIAAGLLSLKETGVHAGEGSGINEQISTVDEFASLLDFTMQDQGGIPLVGTSSEENEEEKEENEEPIKSKYTSVTFSEISALSISMAEGSVSVERDLTIYIAPNSVYYSSDITMYATSGLIVEGFVSANLEIYFAKDKSLVKFNRFYGTGGVFFPEEIVGKWIDLSQDGSGDIQSAIGMVTDYNFDTLGKIGSYIREYQDTNFTKSGKIYSLKEKEIQAFFESLSIPSSVYEYMQDGCSFEIDLTDPESPALYMKGNHYNDNMYFENINNTVVELPSGIDVLTEEEVERIVG